MCGEKRHIPITKPLFGKEEEEYLLDTLQSGWVVQGPKVAEFEGLFADFTGAKHAVATTSCTTALHLGLIAAGVSLGDEVVVPAFTWIATANVIEYVGAVPIFCDIDLRTFNLDVGQLEGKITGKTRAIIPVHLFGLCAKMDLIMDCAQHHGLEVIEDSACGLGASYRERHAGRFGSSGCFSFHPRKAITTGEGGMLITESDEIAVLCRALRDHGASVTDAVRHASKVGFLLPEFELLGYNYRMTDLQGALGVAQMGRLGKILEERRELARNYDSLLGGIEELQIPLVPDHNEHGYQSYVCLCAPPEPSLNSVEELHQKRNQLMVFLQERGVATRQGTHAVHTLNYYQKKYGLQDSDFPQALMADCLSLALPLFAGMVREDQEYVVENIRVFFKGNA